MKTWNDFVAEYVELSDEKLAAISHKLEKVYLHKGDYFSEAAKVPNTVAYVLEGVLRGVYYTKKGDAITRCFIPEGSLSADYINFEAATTSTEYIEACTNCTLLVFSKKSWEQLSEQVVEWNEIKNKMVHQCMYQKSRKGPVISQDATARYEAFLENYPNLANRVPLSHIASYLGVTLQSLSRIRKNVR
ncbi:Crp/Fnr family transcriptional regulator [Sphingobacterium corticis]|uniref:Crp/Fnr family transcriptional regulator n=1 Tax=Sphingobacterium corticis TaxID=1812823 RepID=A0ABW5NJ65_9SPHI